jgi:succinate dehydrogenase hydrophobic anchor subunit
VVLLLAIAIGLFGYAIWRVIEGVQDKSRKGSGGKGVAHRVASVASGVVNGALAVAVLQLALGNGGGSGSKSWVGALLEQPFGAVLLALIGAAIIIAGLIQLYKAYTKKFLEDFRSGGLSPTERRWITRAGQVGYSARGVVFPIVGVGFVKAALDHDPGQSGGMREALTEIASSGHGQLLLGLVSVGLLAFGLFMVASARYRTIPT